MVDAGPSDDVLTFTRVSAPAEQPVLH
jgi:hypothetical protein